MDYWLGLVIFAAIYTVAALSFSLLLGHAGIFSVAHAAFIGIGAYSTGALTTRTPLAWPVAFVLGAAVAAILGWVFARATLRVNGDYMVVASFALLVIAGQVAINWSDVTGGGNGLPGVPRPGTETSQITDNLVFCAFAVVVAALAYAFSHLLVHSPFGRVLRTLRENDVAASSLGKHPRQFRGVVFAVSSGMAAVAGSLYAHYVSYVSPLDFTITLTVLLLTIVIVAGTNRLWAVPLGAALVVGLTEGVRYVELPSQIAAGADQVLYGALLVAFALLRPEGLLGRKKARR